MALDAVYTNYKDVNFLVSAIYIYPFKLNGISHSYELDQYFSVLKVFG